MIYLTYRCVTKRVSVGAKHKLLKILVKSEYIIIKSNIIYTFRNFYVIFIPENKIVYIHDNFQWTLITSHVQVMPGSWQPTFLLFNEDRVIVYSLLRNMLLIATVNIK